jgi:pimeloyl-ACP methyl ester carboxylesterase
MPSGVAAPTFAGVTTVFVHGLPETEIVWDPLADALDGTSVSIALPGFGAPLPGGFIPSKDGYANWLTTRLETIEDPIDLVGHDFGSVLCLRLVTGLETRVRSWTVDLANLFHPAYVWHRTARIWQTLGAGEEAMARVHSDGAEGLARRAARLGQLGVPSDVARAMSAAHDEVMSRCILGLYRSAQPNVRADWAITPAGATAPGLVLHAAADPFGDASMSGAVAGELGAAQARLDDLGHMWMIEDPRRVAALLERFRAWL